MALSKKVPNSLSLPYLFEPRSYQWALWAAYDRGIRRFLLNWHRRAGKDKTLLNFCIERMLERKGNYLHVFPLQNEGRRIIWTGIDREGLAYLDHFPESLILRRNDADMMLTLRDPAHPEENGSTYQIVGTDRNLDVIVGANPVGMIFSEFALQNPRAWDLARPILRENGGWAAFVMTPRGKNHGYRLYQQNRDNPDWYVSTLTVEDTRRDGAGEDGAPVISQADVEADQREGMDDALVQQEYYVSFEAAIPGAYYAREFTALEQRKGITLVPYDPTYGVYTFWDIGVDDATAIWAVQFIGRQVCLIWYHEDTGHGLPHYAQLLIERDYQYRAHILPHDAGVREWSSGVRRLDTATLMLPGAVEAAPRLPLADGISAVRTLFPRLLIDQDGCERGIEALRSYHHEWDEQRHVFMDRPSHDWASHGSDALRTLATSLSIIDRVEKRWQGRPQREDEVCETGLWADSTRGESFWARGKYGWMGG